MKNLVTATLAATLLVVGTASVAHAADGDRFGGGGRGDTGSISRVFGGVSTTPTGDRITDR